MKNQQPSSRSYILRLWWTRDEGTEILRIYVENPNSGERKGFSGLEQLNAFLRKEIGTSKETLYEGDRDKD
jgi:hypothetical protein